jgi:hypothetical protein
MVRLKFLAQSTSDVASLRGAAWDDPGLSDKAVQGVRRYVPSQLAFPLPHGNSGLQALEFFVVDIL